MLKRHFIVMAAAGLVTGNLVGVGILALPISLGLAGVLPAFVSVILYTLMMLFTAEVIAREAGEAKCGTFDYPSLFEKYLGKAGKWLAVITNTVILYGLLIAYISCATQIIVDACGISGNPVYVVLGISFVLIYMTLADLEIINKCNTFLVIGLFAVFVGLIVLSMPHIVPERLSETHWSYFGLTIPIVVTAAYFHNIIPTLCCNLKWNVKLLRRAIIAGTVIATVMNCLWTVCGIGCLQRLGENGLVQAYVSNLPATVPMRSVLHSAAFTTFGVLFSIVAIATSFLANGLGLMNFVKDILHNTFKIDKDLIVKFIAFAPPIVFAVLCPGIFIKALNVVGGIGIVTLFGILPCLISIMKKENSLRFKLVGYVFLFLFIIALLVVIASLCGVGFAPNPVRELG